MYNVSQVLTLSTASLVVAGMVVRQELRVFLLQVTFSMRDDEVTGVDPSVFRKYFREDEAGEAGGSEAEEEEAQPGYNRAEVRDYKMPRRKTTKRKKQRKPPEPERLVTLKKKLRGVILMFPAFQLLAAGHSSLGVWLSGWRGQRGPSSLEAKVRGEAGPRRRPGAPRGQD